MPFPDHFSTDIKVLEAVRRSSIPIGAGSLSLALRESGLAISEAGAGRLLRSLRERGFLRKEGFRGHTITPEGSERLIALRNAEETAQMLKRLVKDSQNMKGHSVSDILTVRKAIEREAVYRAAQNATPGDIAKLESIVENQYKEMKRRSYYADISADFHREVLRISNLPLLEIIYEFIGITVEWQNFFIETFRIFDTPLNVSHEKILDAIKEKDPKKAAELMDIHLSDVIKNTENLAREAEA